MRSALDRRCSVVKKKIGGASLAEHCRRIEAVLRPLGPGQKLALDANGRFDLKTAVEYAKALPACDLFQPYGGFPDGVKVESGFVTLPELPGIGFEGKADLIAEMRAPAA